MGNNNNRYINEGPFRIVLNTQYFFGNQPITGEIWLDANQTVQLSDIIVSLKREEYWEYEKNEDATVSEKKYASLIEVPLNIGAQLGIASSVKALAPGQYRFPFIIQPQNAIQPSLECSSCAYVRYSIHAMIASPYINLQAETLIIIKAGPAILNSPLSFASNMNVYNWFFFKKGITALQVSFPTNNYRFGDLVPLTINVDNTQGKLNVKELKVNLKRIILYKNKHNNIKRTIKVKVCQTKYPFVVPSKGTNQTQIVFNLLAPVVNLNITGRYQHNFNDINNPLPTTNCWLITCSYYIKVSCLFDSFVSVGCRPNVKMPIAITHQVLNQYIVQPNNQNQFYNNNPQINKPNDTIITNNVDNMESAPPQLNQNLNNNNNTPFTSIND